MRLAQLARGRPHVQPVDPKQRCRSPRSRILRPAEIIPTAIGEIHRNAGVRHQRCAHSHRNARGQAPPFGTFPLCVGRRPRSAVPRSPRLNVPETWHHVMNRGADRQDVFIRDADYERFEWLLGDSASSCGVEIHAYCLMTNHFHLVLYCPIAAAVRGDAVDPVSIRPVVQHRYERDGPVFRGRFRSVLVESDEQLMTVGRYVHRNPLALTSDGLAAYRWSSLGHRSAPRSRLAADRTTDGAVRERRRARFHRFVEWTDLPSDRAAGTPWSSRPTCREVEAVAADTAAACRSTRSNGHRAVREHGPLAGRQPVRGTASCQLTSELAGDASGSPASPASARSPDAAG